MAANFFKIDRGISLRNLSSRPSSPSEGDIIYNSSNSAIEGFANGQWVELSAAAGTPAEKLVTSEATADVVIDNNGIVVEEI